MIYTAEYSSPIGSISLASDGQSLIGLWFCGQKYFQAGLSEEQLSYDCPVLIKTRDWLDRYFKGMRPDPNELPLDPHGSEFRRAVWDALIKIPYGETASYGSIAKALGMPKVSARAIGGAVGHNPISIIIPCHRVIGANGKLTGYAGGIEKKISLLEHEGLKVYGDKVIIEA